MYHVEQTATLASFMKKPSVRLSEAPVLLEGQVARVLRRMAIPQISGVLGMVVYHLIDTIYVGQLGPVQLAAISFTYPVVMVVQALGQGIAQSASALISRTIGEGDQSSTRRLATHAMLMAFVFVVIVAILGIASIDPLFRALGAQEEVLPYIREYMEIWYGAIMFVIATMVANNILRATGEVKIPSYFMLIAAALNAILDPLFIFGLGPFPEMGVRGAAVATTISRSTTFVAAFVLMIFRERLIIVGKGALSRLLESWKEILRLGLPIAGTRLITPMGASLVTRIVASFGTAAVAGYGVANRLEVFSLAFVNALSVVVGPFVGQNIGAGRTGRVKEAFRVSNKYCLIVGLGSLTILMGLPEFIASVFNKDPEVIKTAALYMRIVSASYIFQGMYMVIVQGLNVLRKPIAAASLGVLQMFGLTLPLGLLLSWLFGLPGLFAAVALSYLGTGIASRILMTRVLQDLPPDRVS